MGRPKGSKNKPKVEDGVEPVEKIKAKPVGAPKAPKKVKVKEEKVKKERKKRTPKVKTEVAVVVDEPEAILRAYEVDERETKQSAKAGLSHSDDGIDHITIKKHPMYKAAQWLIRTMAPSYLQHATHRAEAKKQPLEYIVICDTMDRWNCRIANPLYALMRPKMGIVQIK